MAREEKKRRRRGKHVEGEPQPEQGADMAPEARPPEAAGRQVFPPTGADYPPAPAQYPQQQAPMPQEPYPPVAPQQPAPAQPAQAPGQQEVQYVQQQPAAPLPPAPEQEPYVPLVQPEPAAPVQETQAPPTVEAVQRAQLEQRQTPGEVPFTVPPVSQPAPPPTEPAAQTQQVQPPPQPIQAPATTPAQAPALQPQQPAAPPAEGQPVPPGAAQPGYFMPPPWYQPYGVPPSPYFGYPQPGQVPMLPGAAPGHTGQIPVVPGAPPGQTGQIPVIGQVPTGAPLRAPMAGEVPTMMPPGAFVVPPSMPPGAMPPGAFPPGAQAVAFGPLEEPEFESLTRAETSHWRGDFKWVFGLVTALMIFVALATAGLYRVTGPGAAKQVLTPLIQNATQVEQVVKKNYQSLRNKARKSSSANIYIPDIGVTVTISAGTIDSLSSEDLAQRVVVAAESIIYSRGYQGNLPMKEAAGAGEERARATCVTILSKLNKSTHSMLFWPIIIFGVLAVAFGILFMVFCRGWGKVIGAGLAIIAGSLSGSLFLRVGHQFIWKANASGTFKPAANQALRTMSSMAVAYFDIALAAGAVVLLIGVIGAVISRKSRGRVPPFGELGESGKDKAAAAPGQPAQSGPAGSERFTEEEESFFLN
jgi:hypothetical protein